MHATSRCSSFILHGLLIPFKQCRAAITSKGVKRVVHVCSEAFCCGSIGKQQSLPATSPTPAQKTCQGWKATLTKLNQKEDNWGCPAHWHGLVLHGAMHRGCPKVFCWSTLWVWWKGPWPWTEPHTGGAACTPKIWHVIQSTVESRVCKTWGVPQLKATPPHACLGGQKHLVQRMSTRLSWRGRGCQSSLWKDYREWPCA